MGILESLSSLGDSTRHRREDPQASDDSENVLERMEYSKKLALIEGYFPGVTPVKRNSAGFIRDSDGLFVWTGFAGPRFYLGINGQYHRMIAQAEAAFALIHLRTEDRTFIVPLSVKGRAIILGESDDCALTRTHYFNCKLKHYPIHIRRDFTVHENGLDLAPYHRQNQLFIRGHWRARPRHPEQLQPSPAMQEAQNRVRSYIERVNAEAITRGESVGLKVELTKLA